MAKIATAEQTSGAGFDYEDKISAYFLTHLLAGKQSLEVDLGSLKKIQYQVRSWGWLFDDFLLQFQNGEIVHNVAVSAKSNRQITNSGLPSEIVKDLWTQFLNIEAEVFNQETDFILFVVARLASSVSINLSKIIHAARINSPSDMLARMSTPAFSVPQRRLFNSFLPPSHLAEKHGLTTEDICRLLSRLIVKEFDFGAVDSSDLLAQYHILQDCLESKNANEARTLFEKMCALRSKISPHSGFYDYSKLVSEVNKQFTLSGYSNHESDWQKITETVKRALENVPDKVGKTLHIDRPLEQERLLSALKEVPLIYVLGDSGAGKTVLAKTIAINTLKRKSHVLWIDAELLEVGNIENHFRIVHSINDLIEKSRTPNNLLIVDAADRIYKSTYFDTLVSLLRSALQQSNWGIVVTTQQDSYEDLIKRIYRKNLVIEKSKTLSITPINFEELLKVGEHFPKLVHLLKHAHLTKILANLKFLDLVLFHLANISGLPLLTEISETHLIDWLWEEEIGRNREHSAINSRFLQELAERQANTLNLFTPITDFKIEELMPIDELVRNKLIVEKEGRFSFYHDLFGDWARYKSIRANENSLVSFIFGKDLFSPLWSSAIRLYGIYLLEKSNGPAVWLSIYQTFDVDDPKGKLVQNLLLEAIIYSSEVEKYLNLLWEEFKKDDAKILTRFFEQFLFKATLPNPAVLNLESQLQNISVSQLATYHRLPKIIYWFPIWRFVEEKRSELYEIVRSYLLKMVLIWLENMPLDESFRKLAANIAYDNAVYFYEFTKAGGFALDGVGKDFYKLMLLAVNERPEEIIALSLKLSGRVVSEESEYSDGNDYHSPIFMNYNPRRGTEFPDGPKISPDRYFEETCFEAHNLLPLIHYDAKIAKEIILALMIEPPQHVGSFDHYDYKFDIKDIHEFYPPLYNHGPFLSLFQADPFEGLDAVIKLTDFATFNWRQNELANRREPDFVEIEIEDRGVVKFYGNPQVYFWFRNHGRVPDSLVSMLMALEKFIIDAIDKKHDVEPLLREILRRSQSLAFIGLLVSIGKYQPALFRTILKPLLFVFDFYELEMTLDYGASFEQFQMTGANFLSSTNYNLAQEWHGLPHRRRSLKTTALSLMINFQMFRDLFKDEITPKWKIYNESIKRENRIHPLLDNLIAQFNFENYAPYQDEKNKGIIYQEPNDVTERLSAVRADSKGDDFMFSFRNEQSLTSGKKYSQLELEDIWSKIQGFYKEPEYDLFDRLNHRLANIFSGISILLKDSMFIADNPERLQWIVKVIDEVLQQFTFSLRDATMIDGPGDWSKFSASFVPELFASSFQNKKYRKFLGILILHSRNTTVEQIFRELAKFLKVNDPRYAQLVNLYIARSNIINKQEFTAFGEEKDWKKLFATLLSNFIENKTPTNVNLQKYRPKKIKEILDSSHYIMRRGRRLSNLRDSGLDLNFLYQAFYFPSWSTASEGERSYIVHSYQQLKDLLIYRWGSITEDMDVLEISINPFDIWLIERLANWLVDLDDSEVGNLIWQPILSYGNVAGKWLEYFFNKILIQHYHHSEKYAALGSLWNDMIAFASIEATWKHKPHFFDSNKLWESLMGISDLCMPIWESGHTDLFLNIRDKFFAWATPRYMNPELINKLAIILRSPSAANFLKSGILLLGAHLNFQFLLARTEVPEGKVRVPFKYFDSIANTASFLWNELRKEVYEDHVTFEAFKTIIVYLVASQNSIGLELQDRIIEV